MSPSQLESLSDAELVSRCKAGDAEAWNALVDRFSRYVSTICLRRFRLRAEDAEDVFQALSGRAYRTPAPRRGARARHPGAAHRPRRRCLDTLAAGPREHPEAEPVAQDREERLDEIDEAFAVREALGQLS